MFAVHIRDLLFSFTRIVVDLSSFIRLIITEVSLPYRVFVRIGQDRFSLALIAILLVVLRGLLILLIFLIGHIAFFRSLTNIVSMDKAEKMMPGPGKRETAGKRFPKSGRRPGQWGADGPTELERIANRQIQHHIADIRGAFEIPLGPFGLPGSPERNGDIDPKDENGEIKAQTGTGAYREIF